MVERGEVFGGASAARDDDHVDRRLLIEVTYACRDFLRCKVPLNLGWKDRHVYRVVTALENVEDVAQSRSLG